MSSDFASDHVVEPGQIFLIPTTSGQLKAHHVVTLRQHEDGDWECLSLELDFVLTLYAWYLTPRRKQ